jgi:Putative Ig domain/Galactose oxidase, central domain
LAGDPGTGEEPQMNSVPARASEWVSDIQVGNREVTGPRPSVRRRVATWSPALWIAALLIAGCGGGSGGPAQVKINAGTPPDGTAGVPYPGMTFSATGGSGAYTWSDGGTLPAGLALSPAGQLSGTPMDAGTYPVTITATDAANPSLHDAAVVSLHIDDSQMIMQSATPPAGTVSYPYAPAYVGVASGGSPPYAHSVTAGTVPPGLKVGSDGNLAGTPSTAGSFTFTVTATDAAPSPQSVSAPVTVVISNPAPPVVSQTPPPVGVNGSTYPGFGFAATGGYLPLTWKIKVGTLPTGLALGTDGTLSGTPSVAGLFPITVMVTDGAPTPESDSHDFVIEVDNPPPPTIDLHLRNGQVNYIILPPTGTVGTVYQAYGAAPGFQFKATDGLAPLVWSESGALPGLVFSLDGLLSGTPTAAGRFPITVNVVDALKQSAVGVPLTIRVSAARAAAAFTATGSMAAPRWGHTATLLANGKVLVTGGMTTSAQALASAETYDPATGIFTATGSMAVARSRHAATLLNSGKVLVTSGDQPAAELYDPATGIFSATGSFVAPHSSPHSATLLNNGKVLIAGGNSAAAELFDPASATFAATGSMTATRTGHVASLLADGRVLVAGGGPDTAEIYDPTTGTFAVTAGSPAPAPGMGPGPGPSVPQSATRLPDGRVLVCGTGIDAQVFDPSTGLFAPVGDLIGPITGSTASLLRDGTVLLAGGYLWVGSVNGFGTRFYVYSSLTFAERFAPESEGFTATGLLATARDGHTATVLADGSVLVVGGVERVRNIGTSLRPTVGGRVTFLSSAELYK